MAELVNPYIAGAPVVEARMFFGREDVFEWIQNSLTGKYSDHILVLHGQRRVGKTSVLKQLGNFLPEKYIPVFFDLQGRTHTTLDRFLWWLAREIIREVKQKVDISLQPAEKESFSADPDYFETHFLPALKKEIGDHIILLTFDEFDNLEESEVKEDLAIPLIDYLRRLMEQPEINFIFSIGSSGRKLENMQAAYTEFFKTALYKKISFLTREQCEKLVRQPVEGILQIDESVTGRIFEVTSGHPYFTQLCCHELFSLCQRTGQLTISNADLESILDDVVERGTVNLKFVWDEASDLEKWVLAVFSANTDVLNESILHEKLKSMRVRFNENDLTSALLHLKEKDVLTRDNGFVIELLKRWLQKNRTLEQVREELTETNPIANRYIEIGQEFQETGQYARAIENYMEALTVSPGHTRAQVNIGSCYLEQKSFGQAIAAFEKALEMDDEEIAARSGLCNAYLALGDDAVQKGKPREAQKAFLKVLEINAEHTESRQRLATLEERRAEKAMKDGREEEAFEAYIEAVKYLPEDADLAQRFEAAKKGKQERVISGLLTRVEKLIVARNWEEATNVIKTTLEIDEQHPKARQMEQTIADQVRHEKLNVYFTRAEKAQKNSMFELAEAALTAYLELAPDDNTALVKLEAVRLAACNQKIDELSKRARAARAQEKFDDSRTLWQQLLDFAPEEKSRVIDELEDVEKAQKRAETYSQAQQAYAKKNYDKAASLFKSIVMEDENYKDTARLFTESLELQRRTRSLWKQKWFTPILLGVVIVGLTAVLGGLFINGKLFPPAIPSETAASPAGASTPAPTFAEIIPPTPTSTLAPLPLSWTRLAGSENFIIDKVSTIVVDPEDQDVMFAGMANSGIYKSIDGGETWLPKQAGMVDSKIMAIIIDPTSTNTVYALAVPGGVYKSTNGGEDWEKSSGGLQTGGGYGGNLLSIDPLNVDHLIVVIGGRVYETRDGAVTWSQMANSCLSLVRSLAINPKNTEEMVIVQFGADTNSACGDGVLWSNDGGQTWTHKRMESIDYYSTISYSSLEENRILLIANNQLYETFDTGETWKRIGNDSLQQFYFTNTPGKLYASRGGRVYSSTNSGMSWSSKKDFGSSDVLLFANSYQDLVIVANQEVGIQISRDGGNTWSASSNGVGADQLDLVLDPYHNGVFYAYSRVDSIFKELLYQSNDSGRTWSLINDIARGIGFDADGKTIYRAGVQNLLYSSNQGQTWGFLPYVKWNYNYTISVNPLVSGNLFIEAWPDDRPDLNCIYSCQFETKDSGKTWVEVPYIPAYWSSEGQRLYASNATSDDGGVSWSECGGSNNNLAPTRISAMAIDPTNPKIVYRATRGGGVQKSFNACTDWASINKGLKSLNVNSIVIDPEDSQTLYIGTDSGAYVTYDVGSTWQNINDGLLGVNVVSAIAIDPNDGTVYASTPYGIFKLVQK